MAWSKAKTIRILIIVLILSLIFALAAIALTILNLNDKEGKLDEGERHWTKSLIYYLATIFGTGLGCIWFRLFHAKMSWSHGILHLLIFILMVASHRAMIDKLSDGDMDGLTHRYCLCALNIPIYLFQILLSIHLVIIRYGRTPSEKAFRSGLHAFLGALTFFICVTDAVVQLHHIARELDIAKEITSDLAIYFTLLYAICTWYVILNPYFDWRRLHAFILLSFHLVVFRSGRTPAEEAYRSGVHAFLGSLVYFECISDAICVMHRMSRDGWFNREKWADMAIFSCLFYAVCTWYLTLNPYFDWRRLSAMKKAQNVHSKSRSPRHTPRRKGQFSKKY